MLEIVTSITEGEGCPEDLELLEILERQREKAAG